ncbi:hypothetical protein Riv7116_2462 [Rivularia sp. PCC 7116]|uniref:DUF6272 family protein n=1 Tax=Rivularia sp. PCC 7116 TaxID=373994 RepID=UPI00029F0673|nr:DUF6272 family protein [Rivularia sp. PCC 7116]AFY54972.1 hypothetical protein Riv7116_2462 [Rivularia sp. PCC 7116]
MVQVFGDFVESTRKKENLTLGFSPSSVPIEERWRNNGLSADYIAEYLTTVLNSDDNESGNENYLADIKSSASYIANELLENGMKYCNEQTNHPVTFHIELASNEIRFFLENTVIPASADKLKEFIEELNSSDPDEFYIRQLEKTAEADLEDNTSSGLGFLSIINDYSAKLGWKFQTLEQSPLLMSVTTLVRLMVQQTEQAKPETIADTNIEPLEVKGENFHIVYNNNSRVVDFSGRVRMRGLQEYSIVFDLFDKVIEINQDVITLDLQNLELINSSGIDMLSKFIITTRKKKTVQINIIGSSSRNWQTRLLKNFQRLMPKLQYEFR